MAKDIYQRLYSKSYRADNGCLEWCGACSSTGRPQFRFMGKTYLTSRFIWEIERGPIPKGLCVLHSCDNGRCIDIEHFFLGTKKDNSEDMVRKSRNYQDNVCKNSKLSEETISAIKNSDQPGWWLAGKYQVSQGTVSMIRHNKIHKRVK